MFWARNKLRLSVSLVAHGDGKVLWAASSALGRSEGGLPFSLVGVPVFAY